MEPECPWRRWSTFWPLATPPPPIPRAGVSWAYVSKVRSRRGHGGQVAASVGTTLARGRLRGRVRDAVAEYAVGVPRLPEPGDTHLQAHRRDDAQRAPGLHPPGEL